jgi:peroxiredoxin
MTNRGQWFAVLAVVGVIGGGVGIGMVLSPSLSTLDLGSPAPEFEAVDVRTGQPVGFTHGNGSVTLLNIWATSCIPCEQEMPSMQRLFEAIADSAFRVLAVSIDVVGRQDVRQWVDERGLTFEIWHDQPGDIQRTYLTTGVPESYVIDRHGTIVKRIIGPKEWDHPSEVALMRRLLADAGV